MEHIEKCDILIYILDTHQEFIQESYTLTHILSAIIKSETNKMFIILIDGQTNLGINGQYLSLDDKINKIQQFLDSNVKTAKTECLLLPILCIILYL